MTTEAHPLITPAIDLATFASTLTARASHAQALAALANDAAAGHPRQRAVIDRNVGGLYHVMIRRGVARWLLIRLVVGTKGTWTASEKVDVDLSIGDGTTTITSADSRIPDGLKADTAEPSPLPATGARIDALGVRQWVIDLEAFETGGTSLSGTRWTLSFDIAVTGTHTYCELLTVEELPRWLTSDADDYGVLAALYLQRSPIIDSATGVQRLWSTARYGYTHGWRTYHQMVRDEAAPWSIVATSPAAWPGDEESAGVARKYTVNARTMRGTTDPQVAFRVRYRLTGASPGDQGYVSLITGAGTTKLTLTDASGAWAEAETTATLDAATPEQHVSWKAHKDAGPTALEIDARTVVDDPA